MENLKNIKGAKALSQKEQKTLLGGIVEEECLNDHDCPPGYSCVDGGNTNICAQNKIE